MGELVLEIKDHLIHKAEEYARIRNEKLDDIIAAYPDQLAKLEEIDPKVSELPKGIKPSVDDDYKKAKVAYLTKKYLK